MPSDYSFEGKVGFSKSDDLSRFVPTLFLGLGGTGKDILMRFRKKLYDEYGMPNERFARFLVIDTDAQTDTPHGERDQVYAPVVLRRDQGEFIPCTIEPTQFKKIVEDARQLPDRRYSDWLHPQIDAMIRPQAFANGAGTYRQGGRLALFRNYPAIHGGIKRHFSEMMEHAAKHPTTVFGDRSAEVDDKKLEVVIVTSLAGGTGAGMFIDVAYLVRDILDHDPDFSFLESRHSTVIAVLPTVYAQAQPSLAKRFRQNAYAALMEMEYYNTPRQEEHPFESDLVKEDAKKSKVVEFYVNWEDPRKPERPIRTQAWDTCYLIDDVNPRRPGASLGIAGVCQMVADYLYSDFGTTPFAIAKRSARPNHLQLQDNFSKAHVYETTETTRPGAPESWAEPGSDVLFENKYGCTFSSFGLAEISIDKNRINRCAAYRLAARLVRDLWLADPARYGKNQYQQWAVHDLTSGDPPPGLTEPISFRPDEIRKMLLRDQQSAWLSQVESDFDQLGKLDPSEGLGPLESALSRHAGALAGGAARRTMELQLARLQGNAADPGPLRTRIEQLARGRLHRIGVLPTIELLREYREAFADAAKLARSQAGRADPKEGTILARLREAERVPFPCRGLAISIERGRTCEEARRGVRSWYATASSKDLETLVITLANFVGGPEQPAVPGIPETLYDKIVAFRKFLVPLALQLDKRFEEMQAVTQTERNISLVNWSPDQYDSEINAVLLANQAISQGQDPGKVNWASVQSAVLRVLAEELGLSASLADLIDKWHKDYKRKPEYMADIAELVMRACQRVLGDGIHLKQFADGNVVDYLTSLKREDRQPLLAHLVDASAPYFPHLADDMGTFFPSYQNVLGRTGGEGTDGAQNAELITNEINGISLAQGANNQNTVRRAEQGPPTSLLLVREVGGIPLNYYNRLRDVLKRAYFDKEVEEQRPTCHVKYRETFADLPDIEMLEANEIAEIRAFVYDVLRAFILRAITANDDGVFQVYIADPEISGYSVLLGTRISRIVRNACGRPDIRAYLRHRWKSWCDRASPAQKAVFYMAIRLTLERFPRVQHAQSQANKPRPIFNCYRNLQRLTRDELRNTPEGREWLKLLHWEGDVSDAGYAPWKEQFDAIGREIREKCLVEASSSLPLYQINEARIGEIRRPGS